MAGLVAVAVLTGCGDDLAAGAGERPCTAMGSVHGLGVVVEADVAPVRDLELEVCVAADCVKHEVQLSPGTSAGETECTGDGPDDSCSAELTPDGTQFGHVDAELPEGPVEVSGSYRTAGGMVELALSSVAVTTSYPNGPDCGADGTQGQVTIDESGIG